MSDAGGRPTKLSPEVTQKLTFALRLGNFRKSAAEYAGISERTLVDWMYRGTDEPDGPYGALRKEVLEAEQYAEITALGCIQQAMRRGEWKAAAWFLERKFPERFCVRAQVFLAQRLQIDGNPDYDLFSKEEMEQEMLSLLWAVTRDIPKARILAALESETQPPNPVQEKNATFKLAPIRNVQTIMDDVTSDDDSLATD